MLSHTCQQSTIHYLFMNTQNAMYCAESPPTAFGRKGRKYVVTRGLHVTHTGKRAMSRKQKKKTEKKFRGPLMTLFVSDK